MTSYSQSFIKCAPLGGPPFPLILPTSLWNRVRLEPLELKSTHHQNGEGSYFTYFLTPGTGFVEDNFFTSTDQEVEGLVWGWFKHITFIVHFMSTIISPAPPQIIRHQSLEDLRYGKEKPRAGPEAAQFPVLYFLTFPSEIQEEKMLIQRTFWEV